MAVATIAVALMVAIPGAALAKKGSFKGGTYSGSTNQLTVSTSFRKIDFKIKKGKVTLTTEPVVNRGLCFSGPTFTLDGNPTTRLNKRGAFSFTQTFLGDRIDKIKGRFVSPKKVEGFATYNFFANADLCSEGATTVKFTATKGKKKKK